MQLYVNYTIWGNGRRSNSVLVRERTDARPLRASFFLH